MISVTIDSSQLNHQMDNLYNAMFATNFGDISNLLRDETKYLIRTIVNFTPPLRKEGGKENSKIVIRDDLYSLISEAPQDMIDRFSATYGTANIDAYHTKKDGRKERVKWDLIVQNVGNLPELHDTYRGARGRPKRMKKSQTQWISRLVVPVGARDPYVEQVQKKIGRWKAKWALTGKEKCGDDKYPKWITQHFESVRGKSFSFSEFDIENPQITFGGSGPNFRDNIDRIRDAMKLRTRVIGDRIKLMWSGYAADMAKSIRIAANAHKTPTRQYVDVEE